MKVEVLSLTDEEAWEDCGDVLQININGKQAFCVWDGEPEDANLSRDFNDCWQIADLMRTAYEAGVNGESFDLERKKVTREDL